MLQHTQTGFVYRERNGAWIGIGSALILFVVLLLRSLKRALATNDGDFGDLTLYAQVLVVLCGLSLIALGISYFSLWNLYTYSKQKGRLLRQTLLFGNPISDASFPNNKLKIILKPKKTSVDTYIKLLGNREETIHFTVTSLKHKDAFEEMMYSAGGTAVEKMILAKREEE